MYAYLVYTSQNGLHDLDEVIDDGAGRARTLQRVEETVFGFRCFGSSVVSTVSPLWMTLLNVKTFGAGGEHLGAF